MSSDASPVLSRTFRHRSQRWLLACASGALVVLAGWGAHRWTWERGLERLSQAADHRLEMAGAAVEAQLARFDYLPSLLENTPAVLDLLGGAPRAPLLRDEVNHLLRALNATAGAEMLYVLDRGGLTVAAADWDHEGSPYGMNLSFRPYVQEALAHGRGRFYGVGVTSGRAGYYLSYALRRGDRVLGLATAKVSLTANERAWSQLPGHMLLADERGVVILSSEARWRYRPLVALTAAQRAEIAHSRPYGASTLQPLDWHAERALDPAHEQVRLDGRRYLVSDREVHGGRWHLRSMDDLAPLAAQSWQAALTGALVVLVAALLGGLWAMRRRTLRQRLRAAEALQAAHGALESKVVQRTAELRRTNEQLQSEVEARRRTEDELRATQQELVHSGKMAALGQMSAGMMHELNQPLAAMRTLADNAAVLLDQGREADVRHNLHRLTHLVDRLGKLTAQLKLFAWKPGRLPLGAVKLAPAVAQAQFVLGARQREQGVEIEVEIVPPTLTVRADEGRLEQVLINLMGNGLEAMAHAARPARLRVRASVQGGQACIVVQDQGPGIAPDILPRLFEPFTTSKPAGTGLGLGLMISAHFAREFGGALHGENVTGGGARFVLTLPLAGATLPDDDATAPRPDPAAAEPR